MQKPVSLITTAPMTDAEKLLYVDLLEAAVDKLQQAKSRITYPMKPGLNSTTIKTIDDIIDQLEEMMDDTVYRTVVPVDSSTGWV